MDGGSVECERLSYSGHWPLSLTSILITEPSFHDHVGPYLNCSRAWVWIDGVVPHATPSFLGIRGYFRVGVGVCGSGSGVLSELDWMLSRRLVVIRDGRVQAFTTRRPFLFLDYETAVVFGLPSVILTCSKFFFAVRTFGLMSLAASCAFLGIRVCMKGKGYSQLRNME